MLTYVQDDLNANESHILFGELDNFDGLNILKGLKVFYGLEELGGFEVLILRHLS